MEELNDNYLFVWTHYIYIDTPKNMDIYVYMLAATLYFAPPCWFQNKSCGYLKKMGTFFPIKIEQKYKSNNIWQDWYCRLWIAQKCAKVQIIWYFYSKILQITVLQLKKTYNLEIKNELCNFFKITFIEWYILLKKSFTQLKMKHRSAVSLQY